MAAIEPDLAARRPLIDQRAGNQALHPRRPFGVDDPGLERRHADLERIDRAQGRNREPGIVELMPPEQFWRRQIHQAALVLIDQPPALDADMPLLAGRMQRRAHAVGLRLDHAHRFRRLLGAHDRHVALDDRGLLAGDRGQRVAEKFGVIHADRRDDGRQRRLDHIGGIEPAAETDFEQHDIGRMPREQTERRGGLDLEDRDRLAFVGALAMFERAAQLVVVHQHAASRCGRDESIR